MKKPLIEYFNDGIDTIATAADWKYVGKVVLVFIPVVVFTAWYWVVKVTWMATDWVNQKGDALLARFMK